ncbi:MAG: hypothetical protein O7G29_00960 [Acidobacteria bacterium]|nr:hypothetical protein [Acidobacteriota bacterium]
MKHITPASNDPIPLTPQSRVIVRAFNSRGRSWKDESLTWLNEMRAKRFGLIEGHTVELRAGYRSKDFVVLVVEKTLDPIKPLPPVIYFDHWELDAWSGHDIHINCDSSPPAVTIHRHFWERSKGRGETPHFKSRVLPLIDELISSFDVGRSSWAS